MSLFLSFLLPVLSPSPLPLALPSSFWVILHISCLQIRDWFPFNTSAGTKHKLIDSSFSLPKHREEKVQERPGEIGEKIEGAKERMNVKWRTSERKCIGSRWKRNWQTRETLSLLSQTGHLFRFNKSLLICSTLTFLCFSPLPAQHNAVVCRRVSVCFLSSCEFKKCKQL